MKTENSTIAAIATAPGTGGIGIIRVSGEASIEIVDSIFRSPSDKKLSKQKSHTIHYGHIIDPVNKEVLDEVLVMLMKGPRTYTGEDTVEINCHGGPYVEKRILEEVLKSGALMAEPGEFSKRAFLNGKMDLSQAEAVMDLIASRSKMSQRASMEQLRGGLAVDIERYRSVLLDMVTMIEANIDYPEYDVEEITMETLEIKTGVLFEELTKLYATADSGRMIREGIRTAIAGRPNVGKSSLMNRMLRYERAIVTDIPGTTRDVLEEFIDFGGIPMRLADTAGIRDTDDVVEQIGVDRARQYLEESDLVLMLLDAGSRISEEEKELLRQIQEKPHIIVMNKVDIVDKTEVPKEVCEEKNIVWISAKEGTGMEELQKMILDLFFAGSVAAAEQSMISNLRQKEALKRAILSLESAKNSIHMMLPQDVLMIDYTECYNALGEISGHSLKDDVIDEIFKRFCLGK